MGEESTLFYWRESDCTTLDKTKGIKIAHVPQHFVIFWKNLRTKKLVVRKKPVYEEKQAFPPSPHSLISLRPDSREKSLKGPHYSHQLRTRVPSWQGGRQNLVNSSSQHGSWESKALHSLAPRPKGGVPSKHLEAETGLLTQRVARASTPPHLGTPAGEPKDQGETWTLKTTA